MCTGIGLNVARHRVVVAGGDGIGLLLAAVDKFRIVCGGLLNSHLGNGKGIAQIVGTAIRPLVVGLILEDNSYRVCTGIGLNVARHRVVVAGGDGIGLFFAAVDKFSIVLSGFFNLQLGNGEGIAEIVGIAVRPLAVGFIIQGDGYGVCTGIGLNIACHRVVLAGGDGIGLFLAAVDKFGIVRGGLLNLPCADGSLRLRLCFGRDTPAGVGGDGAGEAVVSGTCVRYGITGFSFAINKLIVLVVPLVAIINPRAEIVTGMSGKDQVTPLLISKVVSGTAAIGGFNGKTGESVQGPGSGEDDVFLHRFFKVIRFAVLLPLGKGVTGADRIGRPDSLAALDHQLGQRFVLLCEGDLEHLLCH